MKTLGDFTANELVEELRSRGRVREYESSMKLCPGALQDAGILRNKLVPCAKPEDYAVLYKISGDEMTASITLLLPEPPQ